MLELLVVLISELYPDAICNTMGDSVLVDCNPYLCGQDMFNIKRTWQQEMNNDKESFDIVVRHATFNGKYTDIWMLTPVRLIRHTFINL